MATQKADLHLGEIVNIALGRVSSGEVQLLFRVRGKTR